MKTKETQNNTSHIPTINLQPATDSDSPIALRENAGSHLSISIRPSSAPAERPEACIAELPSNVQRRASQPHGRNGKIARLPKLQRDLVNRMLYNNIPYCKIVGAL